MIWLVYTTHGGDTDPTLASPYVRQGELDEIESSLKRLARRIGFSVRPVPVSPEGDVWDTWDSYEHLEVSP
jgi:hypothetical protein